MAKKAQTPSPTNRPDLAQVAKWAVPLITAAAAWLREHPEVLHEVLRQIAALIRTPMGTSRGKERTVALLREQVDYLRSSADDVEEVRRADSWAKELDRCARAIQTLGVPGTTKEERRAVKQKLEALRAAILRAYIEERGEDADHGRDAGASATQDRA